MYTFNKKIKKIGPFLPQNKEQQPKYSLTVTFGLTGFAHLMRMIPPWILRFSLNSPVLYSVTSLPLQTSSSHCHCHHFLLLKCHQPASNRGDF